MVLSSKEHWDLGRPECSIALGERRALPMATSPREPSACTGLPLPFNIILSLENQLIISLTHDAHPPSVNRPYS